MVDKRQQSYAFSAPYIAPLAPSAYVSSTTYVSSARYAPSAYVSSTTYVSSARYASSTYVSSTTYVTSARYASSAPTRRTSSNSLVVGHQHTVNNKSPADTATEFRAGFGRASSEPEATSSDRGFFGHANKRQNQASRFRLRCCEFGADGPNLGHKNSSLMILW
jgi:hypothetical protein